MWTHQLPAELQARVAALIEAQPASALVLRELYEQPPPKKQRVEAPPPTGVKIGHAEVIFELKLLSFVLPLRRKLSLVFHLLPGPEPALSVTNAAQVPDLTLTDLAHNVQLAVIVPILGNSTNSQKKDTGLLCLWTRPRDGIADPIVCNFNLDSLKKQLTADGKIPPNAEAHVPDADPLKVQSGIKPLNELIIDFLQRQFSLCGIRLLNFMPSLLDKNSLLLHTDTALALALGADDVCDFVCVRAYRGSKEGALLLMATGPGTAVVVFGFKKPIVLVEFAQISLWSYKDITRFTFNITFTANKDGEVETYNYDMIDQLAHHAVDTFVRRLNVADESFHNSLREKKEAPQEPELPEHDDEDDSYDGHTETDAEEFDSESTDLDA